MKSRSRYLVFILLSSALVLSACGPDTSMDLEEVLDPEVEYVSEDHPDKLNAAGSATVVYEMHFNNPNMKFDIHIPFGISFFNPEAAPGRFEAEGTYEKMITMSMVSTNGSDSCQFTCDLPLKFIAAGQIDLGPDGQCQIPMSFRFIPQGDYLLYGDCPEGFMALVDCTVMSTIMMDPTLYTLTGKDPVVTISKTNELWLEAGIKDLILPEGMAGTCEW